MGIDPQSLLYGFQNEIMNHPCSDGGPENNRIGYTKFDEGCTKFCEGCTKHSKVGIDPKSLPYGFQNEIMDHPCSDGGPRNNKVGCTKFNEGCTKFCEWCTKGSKVHSEVGIGSQTLPYGFLNEIMDHPYLDGGPESDKIGCTKFNEGCTKFCEGCTKGGFQSEFRGGDRPPKKSLWVPKWNHGPSMFKWGSHNDSRM